MFGRRAQAIALVRLLERTCVSGLVGGVVPSDSVWPGSTVSGPVLECA